MILQGDCRFKMRELPEKHFHTCVTSPPYWGLRDYGIPPSEWPEVTYTPMPGLPTVTVPAWIGCLGLEPTPEMFVAHTVLVFREVRRVLRDDGTLWLNFGDTFVSTAPGTMGDNIHIEGTKEATKRARKIERRKVPGGLKPKDLVGIPWRVAFALQADGWYLRMDNIWNKPNPMPESVTDRPTKSHEYIFLLAKSERYYYDQESILEPVSPNTHARLSQNVQNQIGSERANGGAKTNGNMKAVGRGTGVGFGHGTDKESRGRVRQLPGNKTHRGTEAYLNGDQYHRTKGGLVSYAEKQRKLAEAGSGTKNNESFDAAMAIMPSLRNKRSVWTVTTQPYKEAHFATFPEKLIEPCILAGAPVGGHVLDPFGGSGTTLKVALENGRECTIIEIGEQYVEISERRTDTIQPKMQFESEVQT